MPNAYRRSPNLRFFAVWALAAALLLVQPAQADVVQRTYVATLSALAEEPGDGERQVTLSMVLRDNGNDQRDLIWVQTQEDVRSFSWLHRFGHTSYMNADPNSPAWPTIRFNWGEGVAYVPVNLAIPLPTEPITMGSRWENGELTYEVLGQENLGDLQAWRISVRSNFGEKRTVLVEPDRPVIVGMRETVFLGQGQQYALTLALQDSQPADDAAWQKASEDFSRLDALRTELGGASELEDRAWSNEQLQAMKQQVPELERQITSPQFKPILKFVAAESKFERGRAGALEEMRRQALARKLPPFQFDKVTGSALEPADLQNAVAVLHFWDYQEAPLREPYGQVGYLDFLFRKYQERGVHVMGVVVNQQAEVPEQRRNAKTSARKFASFMNLAYPLYVDEGSLLKEIGDPRLCDTPLPLFVVIGRDGQIRHYSAGYYQVNANEGLIELEAAVKEALDTGE